LRNRLFDRGLLPIVRVPAPVVSVGNISVGGTGKTPFVQMITGMIEQLAAPGKVGIGIVSRGYRRRSRGQVVVSDGRRILSDPVQCGDEPVMLAEACHRAVVIVDSDRVGGVETAIRMKSDLILLDDGFQHRRLARDIDIVLLDARNPLGRGLLLPAGFLREPASSLRRADVIILSGVGEAGNEVAERCAKMESLTGKPVIATRLEFDYWRRVGRGELLAADQIAGKKVVAFAGIAKPDRFFEAVEHLGGTIAARIALPDHCTYSKATIDHIARAFTRNRAEWLVTTPKDAVKLPSILSLLPLYRLDARMKVVAGEESLTAQLRAIIEVARRMKAERKAAN